MLDWAILRSLRTSLHGVYIRGSLPDGPFVLATNHHSFFDGYFVYLLVRERKGHLLISKENLEAFPFFRTLGALSVEEIRTAIKLLAAGEPVAIFPEGELRPQGALGEFKRGAVFLAQKANVPLIPAAFRVFVRGFERPEGYINIGLPVPCDLKVLAEELQRLLSELDFLYQTTHPREPFPDFQLLLPGHRGIDEKIFRFKRRFSL
ncbi:1-acyl-sn-glycerol-3-phosphate acyltransferase [Candidatus Bipolaricaulota bacterium]|nr:1-acyl-sn-glycerol-3-phosphate acyltransferase [Candidatus Bipolaricaulota bacterium]